jgi:glutamine---fructose-6-phosphate transaminase (isomerizing)
MRGVGIDLLDYWPSKVCRECGVITGVLMPWFILEGSSPVLEKVVSNMQEVRARGARVVAVVSEGSDTAAAHADDVLAVPRTDWMLEPILAVIPLQLLAYRIARLRGLNVDQPRNLAKTVTVE